MQKQLESPVPILLGGCIFFMYSLFFPMYRITDVAVALGISAISYFLLNKITPGKIIELPEEMTIAPSGNERADELIKQGQEYIRRLSELAHLISNEGVGRQIDHLINISRQIFDFVSKNPMHHRKINTFMEYYYPTALKFLESYVEFSSRTVKGENIQATLDKISASLTSIEAAFEHQLDNLYSDKALDIKTDIAVLENIMEREGVDTNAKLD